MHRFALAAILLLGLMGSAYGQGQPLTVLVVPACGTGTSGYAPTQNRLATMDPTGKFCTNSSGGTVTVSGFTPNGSYTGPLLVSDSSTNVALPTGDVVAVSNVGSIIAYVNLGTSGSVTATTATIPVQPGSTVGLTVGANTFLAAITSTSTTTLNLAGGSGVLSGFGGGGPGGSASLLPVFVVDSGTINVSSALYGAILWASASTGSKNQSVYTCNTEVSGRVLIIKDEIGTAATYPVTLTPVSGTIDSAAFYIMNFNFQSVSLLCDGAGNWILQ